MQRSRHCPGCGELLPADGNMRCIHCLPALSRQARLVGEARRREMEEIAKAERQVENLEILIRRINRRLK
jgi:hypothetical protein